MSATKLLETRVVAIESRLESRVATLESRLEAVAAEVEAQCIDLISQLPVAKIAEVIGRFDELEASAGQSAEQVPPAATQFFLKERARFGPPLRMTTQNKKL